MVRILQSKHDPDATVLSSCRKGDKVLWTSKDGHSKVITLDSDPMPHNSYPSRQLGFECIFEDGERAFAFASQMTMIK